MRTNLKWSLRLIIATTLLVVLWLTARVYPYPLFGHVIVEYPAEVEGYSFANIMADSVHEAATYSTLRRRCSTRPVPTE